MLINDGYVINDDKILAIGRTTETYDRENSSFRPKYRGMEMVRGERDSEVKDVHELHRSSGN